MHEKNKYTCYITLQNIKQTLLSAIITHRFVLVSREYKVAARVIRDWKQLIDQPGIPEPLQRLPLHSRSTF